MCVEFSLINYAVCVGCRVLSAGGLTSTPAVASNAPCSLRHARALNNICTRETNPTSESQPATMPPSNRRVSYCIRRSPSGYGWLGIPGVSQAEKAITAVPMHMSLCEVRCYCTAAVGLSVYCAGAFEFRKSVGWNRPDFAQDGPPTYTHERTDRGIVGGCHKGKALKCGCCGCHDV